MNHLHRLQNSFLARLLYMFALFLLLTACGARPMPAIKSPPAFSLVAPAAPATSASDALLVIGRFVGDDEVPMRALLADFTETHGIEVEYEGAGEVATLLQERVEAGLTPDVILLPKAHWLGELASAGAIPELSDEVAQVVQANFSSAWVDLVSYQGGVYGVPFDANAKSIVWYRPKALPTRDSTLPRTLEELFGLAEALEAENEVAFVLPGGAGWVLTDWFENILLASAGTQVYDDLTRHRISWTDPTIQEAAQLFVSLLRDEWVMDGVEEAAHLALDYQNFGRAFSRSTPAATMWLGQGSIVNSFAAQNDLQPNKDYDLFPFPADGTTIVIGSVAVGTNNKPQSQALLAFLAQPEAVAPWVKAGGFISPNEKLPLKSYPTLITRHEAQLLKQAQRFRSDLSDKLPPNLGFPYLGNQLRQMLLRPDQVMGILAEIEQVASREQGK
jgi:ABC-type glycerol-3-phosphate transport system substrate-binding protein